MQNLKPLASFCRGAGKFESYLVKKPEDRFSRDAAHFVCAFLTRVMETVKTF